MKKRYDVVIKSIDNLIVAIADGYASDSIKLKLEAFEKEKSELENKIEKENELLKRKLLSREQVEDWFDNQLANVSDETKALIIHTFVKEIIY